MATNAYPHHGKYRREKIKTESIRLIQYFKPHRKKIGLAILSTFFAVYLNLQIPVLVRIIIDRITEETLQRAELLRYLSAFILLAILTILFSRIMRQIPLRLSHVIEADLRRDLFAHLTKLDQEFYRKERTGNLMTRLSNDITYIRDSIGQGLLQGMRTSMVLVMATVVMIIADLQLAIIVFSLYLPMVAIFFIILRIMRKRQKELQETVSEMSNFSQESFAGIRSIKGFALEPTRIAQYIALNKGLISKQLQTACARQSLWPFMAFWFGLGMITIINVAGRRVILGQISLGTLTQFLQYLLYMQWPLLALSWTLSLVQRGSVSWQRVREILEQQPIIRDEKQSKELIRCKNTIEFNHVSLDIENRRVLENINYTLKAGQTLGITGPTGSGKTLLVSLLARLMDPSEGTIKIDGADIRTLTLPSLRNRIGFAAQEPILFSRTLEHNIGFGVLNPSSNLIGWAADIAHLHNDIESFPDQYQTLIGERGVTLSGGQRQRTAISRAIARRPDILILDDVLSAVDTQTESAIMDKLQPVINECTTLFVSHRISTLLYADTIIVLEGGRITQQGTHEELLKTAGYYAELHTMQQFQKQLEAGT